MSSRHSAVMSRQRLLSINAAAGFATLMLAFPLIVVLASTGEAIGPLLVAAVLAMFYVVLFVIYRALADAEMIRATNEWVYVVGAVAATLAGIVWLVWVWQMRPTLVAASTYTPFLMGTASLWLTLASGALVMRRLMRRETSRVAI